MVDGVGVEATRASPRPACVPAAIAHIGLGSAEGGLDIRRMTLQEITFIGTYTYTAADFRDTAAAMFDGRLGPLDWTETGRWATARAPSRTSARAGSPRPRSFSSQTYEEGPMAEIPHLLVHERDDNVGVVVVEGLTPAPTCCAASPTTTRPSG